jgi:vacuolar-type H+-ATPase subunit H
MKEIVRSILKEEEAARDKISKASREAAQIISDAREEAEQLIRQSGLAAKESIRKKQEETKDALFAEKDAVVLQVRKEAFAGVEKKKGDIPRLAGEVFRDIIDL